MIKYINLTDKQYQKACERFGAEVVDYAIQLLDKWLEFKKSLQKQNHYRYFRRDNWAINEAIRHIERKNWGKK